MLSQERSTDDQDDGPVYGSGNVFADLGVPNPELAMAKARLAIEIIQIIRERKLTQTEAGKLIGIKQPRVSNIVRGRLDDISLDALFEYLHRLGSTVEITITSPESSSGVEARSRTFAYGAPSPTRELVHAVAEESTAYDAEPRGRKNPD